MADEEMAKKALKDQLESYEGYIRWVLSPLGTYLNNEDVIAWKEIVLPEPSKYWGLSTGENNINKEKEQ
jgi:hypothetical protein